MAWPKGKKRGKRRAVDFELRAPTPEEAERDWREAAVAVVESMPVAPKFARRRQILHLTDPKR